MRFAVLVMVALFFIGCRHDNCEPKTDRCNGNVVEICNTEKDWEVSANCDDVSVEGIVFKCEVDSDGERACVFKGCPCVFKGGEIPFDTAFDTEFEGDTGFQADASDSAVDAGDGG